MLQHTYIAIAVMASPGTRVHAAAEEALSVRNLSEGFQPCVVMVHNDTLVELQEGDTVDTVVSRWSKKRGE